MRVSDILRLEIIDLETKCSRKVQVYYLCIKKPSTRSKGFLWTGVRLNISAEDYANDYMTSHCSFPLGKAQFAFHKTDTSTARSRTELSPHTRR